METNIKNDVKLHRYFKIFETDELSMTEEYVHKKYKKLALKYHPDKGGSNSEFQDLQEGYDTLLIICRIREEEKKSDSQSYLFSVINQLTKFHSKYQEPIEKIADILLNKIGSFSIQYLESLDIQTLHKIHTYLLNAQLSDYVNNEIIENIHRVIEKKKNRNIIFKNTSLEDMMEKNVYKFNYKEETFFAPLWHSEIEFETSDGEEFSLYCIPDLPKHGWLDENNNLCIYHKLNFNAELLLREQIIIQLNSYCFHLPVEKINIKKSQIVKLEKQGLWKIDENEMFDTTQRTHVYIYLDLV